VSAEGGDLRVRRILVALDASPHSLAALEAAVELAVLMEAEMLGLFVEDVNLLRLAELPFPQEICVSTTTCRWLDVQAMERDLRAQATRLRRTLALHARRARVRWSFQVVRGVIARELLTAAAEADMISLGRVGHSLSKRHVGSTARAVLSEAPCLTLIVQQGERLQLPVMVLYDGSPLAHRALIVAIRLVEGRGRHIIVLIPTRDEQAVERIKSEVTERLKERDLMARYHVVSAPNVHRLARAIQTEPLGTLVLPADSVALPQGAIVDLMNEIEVPILVVR
jgi:nucleotide-binding universal stress UspA family protein